MSSRCQANNIDFLLSKVTSIFGRFRRTRKINSMCLSLICIFGVHVWDCLPWLNWNRKSNYINVNKVNCPNRMDRDGYTLQNSYSAFSFSNYRKLKDDDFGSQRYVYFFLLNLYNNLIVGTIPLLSKHFFFV